MICRYCGSKIEDGVQVCPHCGKSLDDSMADLTGTGQMSPGTGDSFSIEGVNEPVQPVPVPAADRSKVMVIIAAVAGALALAAIIFFAVSHLGFAGGQPAEVTQLEKKGNDSVGEIERKCREVIKEHEDYSDYFNDRDKKRWIKCNYWCLYYIRRNEKDRLVAVYYNVFQKLKGDKWKKEKEYNLIGVDIPYDGGDDLSDIDQDDIHIYDGETLEDIENEINEKYSGSKIYLLETEKKITKDKILENRRKQKENS